MTKRPFSLPLTKVDTRFGHVRMYAMPYCIFWIMFIHILDLEPSYKNSWNSDGYKLCPSRSCFIFILLGKNFMDSPDHDNQAELIEAFNSTSRYLEDLLNIDNLNSIANDNQADVIEAFNSTSRYLDELLNPYFEHMVNQIYPPEQQLNKANTTDTKAPFLGLHLSIIANRFVSSQIYYKHVDFDFGIVFCRFWLVTFFAVLFCCMHFAAY